MKKTFAFVLTGLSMVALVSCGGSNVFPQRSFEPEEWELSVNKPTNALSNDFAWGFDASSLKEVEAAGGKFYDRDGKQEDPLKILYDGGSNCLRLRLWNDPYDTKGNPYGGGTNDLKTDIELAKRAKEAGLKVMVDFHYSDSWVDPGKYWAPKAWNGLFNDEITIKLADFTRDSLLAFKEAGVDVAAVQLGNEINPGIAGISSNNYMQIAPLIKSAQSAVKSVYPSAKTIVHYTNVNAPSSIFTWLNDLKELDSMPDVIGVSYYPYWHGTLSNLQNVLDTIATTYNKEVMVVETSWGNTLEDAEFATNTFNANSAEVGGYAASVQAQATEIADIVNVLSKVPNQKGTGIFWWEPAWLPVKGSGWINFEGYYYNVKGNDWTKKYETKEAYEEAYGTEFGNGYSAWANQAWFDYKGHVLPSAYTYRHIVAGDHTKTEDYDSLLKDTIDVTVNLAESGWKLPEAVKAKTNLDAYRDAKVTWNQSQIDAIKSAGSYTVTGDAMGKKVTANVTAIVNALQDGDFEKQGCKTESAVVAPWKIETTKNYKPKIGDAHIEAKGEMGAGYGQYLHWYGTSDVEFDIYQEVDNLPAGKYNFGMTLLSSYYDSGSSDGSVDSAELYFKIGEQEYTHDIRTEFKGYNEGAHSVTFPDANVPTAGKARIGFRFKGKGGTWGHADNFYFSLAQSN